MLPLTLLNACQGNPILVELKNGETYNGHLVDCDYRMNINLTNVICTSANSLKFTKIAETYIRGNMIKYLRINDQVIDKVKVAQEKATSNYKKEGSGSKDRGDNRGGRGRGRGGKRPREHGKGGDNA